MVLQALVKMHRAALHCTGALARQLSRPPDMSELTSGQPHRDLDLSQNALAVVGGLAGLTSLRRLSLDRNRLTALAGAGGGGLACARGLQALSAADNALASLAGLICLGLHVGWGIGCRRSARPATPSPASQVPPILAQAQVMGPTVNKHSRWKAIESVQHLSMPSASTSVMGLPVATTHQRPSLSKLVIGDEQIWHPSGIHRIRHMKRPCPCSRFWLA